MNLSESLNIATIILGIITASVAYIQLKVSSAKIKLELYNKRFNIYITTLDYYVSIYKGNSESVDESSLKFIKSFRESKFLFDEDSGIHEILIDFKLNAEIVINIERRALERDNTPSVDDRLEKNLKSLEKRLEKYISFRNVEGWQVLYKSNPLRGCLLSISMIAIFIPNSVLASADYCFGLSAKECESVELADAELKRQPEYCKPGFGLSENPFNLSKVQIRICNVTWGRGIERKPSEDDALIDRIITDARSLVRDDAISYLNLIQKLQTGYSCGVMDNIMASSAITTLSYSLNKEIDAVGLAGDKAIHKEIADKIEQALDRGKMMANNGACEEMSPAYRARLLHTARGLLSYRP
ncbi:hypothetical protein LZ620_07735 [Aeromonas salmonicida]|nr:hypothetical protein [Aeromonas salmonicida]